jgi:cytochrome c-type protein NapB
MKKPHTRFATILAAWLAIPLFGLAGPLAAQEKLVSERGDVALTEDLKPGLYRVGRDRDPIPRDYVQQPPLIPHAIKGYSISQDFNKCMDCHSWARYKEAKATKVSLTHFKDREGTELANISPRRYFCLQCHVEQYDAPPLVNNTFKPVAGVR